MQKKYRLYNLILLAVCLGFYLFFAFYDKVIICADSPSYIDMYLSREPFYPTFLAINRMIFGIDTYLMMVVIEQSILAAVAAYAVGMFVGKYFVCCANIDIHDEMYSKENGNFATKAESARVIKYIFMTYMSSFICIATSLLCRFIARRGNMYSNCIMTEGICISLFLVFSVYILEYVFDSKLRYLIGAVLVSLVMISSRKQMYLTLILLVLVLLINEIAVRKKVIHGVILIAVSVIFIIGANKAFENAYSIKLHGEMSSHFNDNRFLTTVVFYVADREDGEYITDSEVRELFYDIYDVCDSEGHMMKNIPSRSLKSVSSHFCDHYDGIQINHMWPMIEEYAQSKVSVLEDTNLDIAREALTDEISYDIFKEVGPKVIDKIAYLFVANCAYGLANSVGRAGGIVGVVSYLLFGIYALFLIFKSRNGLERDVIMGWYTLVAMLFNVMIVSAVIFCQTRYMIYLMPMFYISFLVLLCSTRKESK